MPAIAEAGGVATVVALAPVSVDVEQARQKIDNRQARRQTIAGFLVLTLIVLLLLGSLKLLAMWLGHSP